MGAYENPQVFAPDYRVIQQSFQQGFNTTYQVMQQRKAKKEADKKKRDAAEAAFYNGTSLPPVLGLDKKWNNIIIEKYRESLGGIEGYNDMTQAQKAAKQTELDYMESGMKGLSETILKYQTGNYSSAIDPSILGLLDRIVYPKENDPSGEWGYDIRLGEDGVEFFYTEDGKPHSIPITNMSTWGQLFEDPTQHVEGITNNIKAEIESSENYIRGGGTTADEELISWRDGGGLSRVIDLDSNDIGTINYYNQHVDKGGDYHPTKEMLEKELDAIKEKGGIKDDEGNMIIDTNNEITDEELEAYHKYQDQEITDHIEAEILRGFKTHELNRSTAVKPVLYNTYADAEAFITSEKVRRENLNPTVEYHGVATERHDTFGNSIGYEVNWNQNKKAVTPPHNVDTTGDGKPDTYMTQKDINDQIKLNKEQKLINTKSLIRGEMWKKLNSITALVNDPNVGWESYNDLVNKHLLELIDPIKSKKHSKSDLEKKENDLGRPLTPREEYKTIVSLVDTNEDDIKDDKDVHEWIKNKYLGLKENESILTDQLFKDYKYITMFSRLGIPMIDDRTGDKVVISAVTPTTKDNGDKVLRFDTYYNNKPFPVEIPIDPEHMGMVVNQFMTTLSKQQEELTTTLGTMQTNRERQFIRQTGTDKKMQFPKYMESDERIMEYFKMTIGIDEGTFKGNMHENTSYSDYLMAIEKAMSDEEIKRGNELIAKYKEDKKNKK